MNLAYLEAFIKNLDKAPPIVPYWDREVSLMLDYTARLGGGFHGRLLKSFQDYAVRVVDTSAMTQQQRKVIGLAEIADLSADADSYIHVQKPHGTIPKELYADTANYGPAMRALSQYVRASGEELVRKIYDNSAIQVPLLLANGSLRSDATQNRRATRPAWPLIHGKKIG